LTDLIPLASTYGGTKTKKSLYLYLQKFGHMTAM